jgi:hypothetical protein
VRSVQRSRLLLLAVLALAVWLGALGLAVLLGGQAETAGPEQPAAREAAEAPGRAQSDDHAPDEGPRPREDEIVYNYDVFDERLVVGLSENVFLGEVRGEAGHESIPTTIPGQPGPAQTQFLVDVVQSLKRGGPEPISAGQDVLVSHYGGPDPKTGQPIRVVGLSCGRHVEAAPLEADKRYLFATAYRPQGPFHLIVAQPTGTLPVDGPAGPIFAAYKHALKGQADPTKGTTEDWGLECD